MARSNSIIELNGRRYDAHTGVMIEDNKLNTVKSIKPVSDFKRPAASRHITASTNIHKKNQPSKTLMRHAVKKPSQNIKANRTIAMDVVPHTKHEPKVTQVFHHTDPSRQKRANSVHKLQMVSRFGDSNNQTKADAVNSTKSMPARSSQHEPPVLVSNNLTSVMQRSNSKTNKEKLLDAGLKTSTSHTKTAKKKAKIHHRVGNKLGLNNKVTSIVTSTLAVLVFGGFIAFQNVPNLNVRYASAKAGVRASLPGYQPAGYSVNNHVQYSPGSLTISYKANADNRNYTITQRNTSWNSSSLREHLVSSSGSVPMSYPDSGRTIYLHDTSSADWVEGGIWYSISGNSNLNTDQLIKIAASI